MLRSNKEKPRQILKPIFVTLCVGALLILSACRAPIFRSSDERFAGNPEVLSQVQPYLNDWATLPDAETDRQRRVFEERLGIMIMVDQWNATASGQSVQVVNIVLEVWGDWWRGYLYVSEDVDLYEWGHWKLHEIEPGLYVYNRND